VIAEAGPPGDSERPAALSVAGFPLVDPFQAVYGGGGRDAFVAQLGTVSDTTPPVLSGMPGNQTVEAIGPSGATATWASPTASDVVDGAVTPNWAPASGSTFAIGVTPVTCTASDAAGNSAAGSYVLTDPDQTTTIEVSDGGSAEIELTLNGILVVFIVGDGGSLTFTETTDANGNDVGLRINSVSGNVTLNGSPIAGPVSLVGPPTNADQCKNNNWTRFNFPSSFENQGQCIQFVNTGK
jgi:hypothetical protein